MAAALITQSSNTYPFARNIAAWFTTHPILELRPSIPTKSRTLHSHQPELSSGSNVWSSPADRSSRRRELMCTNTDTHRFSPRRKAMKLLVLGATGGTGLEIVRQAVDRGHLVTAFVRSANRLNELHDRIAIQEGDLLNS